MPNIQLYSHIVRGQYCKNCDDEKDILNSVRVNNVAVTPRLCNSCLVKTIIDRINLKFEKHNCSFCSYNREKKKGIFLNTYFYCCDCEITLYEKIADFLE